MRFCLHLTAALGYWAHMKNYCPSGSRHADNAGRTNSTLSGAGKSLAIRHSPSAAAKLGSVSSKAKTEAAQMNGQKGGRPVGS